MANQPKKYKKFVATAATATLVASAIVPVASASFSDVSGLNAETQAAIQALVDAGVINGSLDKFNPNQEITRGQVVKLLGKWAEAQGATIPADWDTVQRFDDLSVDAADQELVKYAALVKDAGIFLGSNGKLNAGGKITRQQMALVVNRAYGVLFGTTLVELAADIEDVTVADLSSVSTEAQPAVQALADLGITVLPGGNFNPASNVTRAQFALFVARAASTEAPAQAEVASVASVNSTTLEVTLKTATTGLTADNFKITVNGTAVTPTSVTADATGAKYTIKHADLNNTKGSVAVNGVTANFDYTTPVVESVSAINATQVEVKFNTEVNKDDVETNFASLFAIGANNASAAVLAADGKTVKVTFASQAHVEVTDAVLVVNPVKTKADTSVTTAKYTKVFTYKDEVKPTITSVESKTNGSVATSVTVKVSEPVASALAKIDGTYYTISFGGTDTATISGLSLDKATAHTLELINLTDKAGTPNVTVTATQTFNVVQDTTAPTVTLSQKNDKTILVTFSKSMDVASVTAALAANTSVKDEAFAAVTTSAAAVVANTDNKQFTIAIGQSLYTNTTTRNLTVVLPNTIKDSVGNTIATSTQQVTLTKDVVKPTATGYKVIKNAAGEVTSLEVNFSEELLNSGAVTLPTIVNSNGQLIPAAPGPGAFLGGLTGSAVTLGDKKITYTFTTPAKISGVYNFSFGSSLVSDTAETANTSSAFNYNIDFGTATGTFNVTSAVAAANVITVTYPVAVKGGAVANSATDINNYSLAGKPLPAGTVITLDAAQKVATITLPADGVTKTDVAAVFTVNNVKSLTGDSANSFTNTVSVTDNTQPVLNSAVLNTDGSITLGFTETLNTPTVVGDYTIRLNNKVVNDAVVNAIVAGVGTEAGKYIIPNFDIVLDNGTGVAGDGDETVYIDANNSGNLDANDIVLKYGNYATLAAAGYSTATVGGKDAAITSITITTDSAATGADADGNVIKAATTITVK